MAAMMVAWSGASRVSTTVETREPLLVASKVVLKVGEMVDEMALLMVD